MLSTNINKRLSNNDAGFTKVNKYIFFCFFALAVTGVAQAIPLDLSSWQVVNYDFPGHMGAASWFVHGGPPGAYMQTESDPSMLLNGLDQTDYEMRGTFHVHYSNDDDNDDMIGFVFGYQNSSNFYLLDWKKETQFYSGSTAKEGFSIKKISADSKNDLEFADFWTTTGTSNMTLLESNHGPSTGWAPFQDYAFYLNFQPGVFHVEISGSGSFWGATVHDNSFTSGQFGFYSHSQPGAHFFSFEQTDLVVPQPAPTPEPSTVVLLGIGLLGFIGFSRLRKFQTVRQNGYRHGLNNPGPLQN